MKKTIIVSTSALTLGVALFITTAQPKTAISSTAMSVTVTTTDSQINALQQQMPKISMMPMPTLQPFASVNVQYRVQTRTPRTARPTTTPKPSATPAAVIVVTPSAAPSQTATASPTQTANAIPTQTPSPTVTATPVQTTSYTDQVITLVNNERAKAGLPSLTKNDQLTQSAQKYSEYMGAENFFSHTGPDGSTFITRNKAAGYTSYRWLGENIAAGQRSPEEVMRDWMNSPGHKANILSTNAKEIGVGYAVNNNSTYRTYWAQEFGAR
jgi:uncharacterized protein YkwD